MTPTAQAALDQLRDPTLFAWHVPFFLLVLMYLYATEMGAGRWDRVAAGLALWFFLAAARAHDAPASAARWRFVGTLAAIALALGAIGAAMGWL